MNEMDTHIAPGYSAGGCLHEALAGVPEHELLVNRDILSCGPLPRVSPLGREWLDVRGNFLRTLYGDEDPFGDAGTDLLANAHRLRDSRSATLWIGTGLAEQLLLAWVVAVLRETNADLGRFRVVQFDRSPKGSEIVGAGVLSPAVLRSGPPATSLSGDAIDQLARAWAAVTAPTPEPLLTFLASGGNSPPFLRRALRALVDYYPDAQTGLNAWEQRLLRNTRGPSAIRAIGSTLADDFEHPDWTSDGYLFQRLRRMGDSLLPRPFVTLSGNTNEMRTTEIHLTPDGEAALAGRAQFVELNGIDDHVAGVHLSSAAGAVWYRRDGTLVPSSSYAEIIQPPS